MYFEVTVEFKTIDTNSGKVKKEKVKYLVESHSVTESEARIYEHFEAQNIRDFDVKSSTESKIADVIYPLKK